jgi:hypothetical protein
MAGELLLEEVPHALEQIEVGGMGRQPKREAASVLRGPRAHRLGAMVTEIVKHQHQILLRSGLANRLQKGRDADPSLCAAVRQSTCPEA